MTTDPAQTPRLTLRNGISMPQFGYGTLNLQPDREHSDANAAITSPFVVEALTAGYRHLDTAQSYGSERGVGRAIAEAGIPRDELFITSKLANPNHAPADVRASFDQTLDRLGLEYLDLFLIHWPLPTLYDGDYVSTWKAVAGLVDDGRLRSAGVSNFLPEHLDRIVEETGIAPQVNQFERHPHFTNTATVETCRRHGITVVAHSPLGHGRGLLNDPVIGQVAADLGKTPAQVVLRWHLQHGWGAIPKSSKVDRMVENLALFDFELSDDEVGRLDALDRGPEGRGGPNPATYEG